MATGQVEEDEADGEGAQRQIKANTLVSLWDVVMTSEAAETCRGCVETALITLLLSPLLHFADSSLK